MKKILYIIFSLIFINMYSQSTYVNEDVTDCMSVKKINIDDYDIKGNKNIKSIKRLFPLYNVASAKKSDYTEYITYFDEKGKLTKKIGFLKDGNGDTIYIDIIKYENSKIIAETYSNKKELRWKALNIYDTNHNLIETERVEFASHYTNAEKYNYDYDSLGRVIEKIRFHVFGNNITSDGIANYSKPAEHMFFIYSTNQKKVFSKPIFNEVTKKMDTTYIRLYKINEKGVVLEKNIPYGKNLIEDEKKIYDQKGNLVEDIYYGSSEVHKYLYDENNNLLKKTVFQFDKEESFSEYTYDKNNNPLIIKHVNVPKNKVYGSVISEYVYDNKNNWIQKKMKTLDGQVVTVIREIEYY